MEMKELVEAAVKAGLGEVAKVFFEGVKTAYDFKASFKRLETTMLAIAPVIEDVDELNRILDRPVEELDLFSDQLKRGRDLILLCSGVNEWNPIERYNKGNELQTFNKVLTHFFQIYVQAFQVRVIKQLSVGISGLDKKMTLIMDTMKEKLEDVHNKMDTATSNNRNPGCSYHAPIPELTPGLDFPLERVKAMLLEDKDVVLISAPPGCGKTTLANMVCCDFTIKDKFKENIFYVTVSRTAKIKVIVQTIFIQRGYPIEKLEFQSDEDAINQLSQLLNQLGGLPILLVLDDVWSPGLEVVVEKFRFKGIPEYKILVTSRWSSAFQCEYKLNPLDHENAKLLLNHWCFPPGNSYPAVSNETLEKVVKACKGFPLALNVVGLSLRNKPEVVWKVKLDKWSTGPSDIFDSNTDLLNTLKTSLDALDVEKGMETVKDGFLDMGSFPEDQRIAATVLLDMWVELYDLDEAGKHTYYNLLELSTRNLLNLFPTRKADSVDLDRYYCNGQSISQHDMLRELAIHLCRQGSIELRDKLIIEITGKGHRRDWEEMLKLPLAARLVSISTDDTFMSNWSNVQIPKAEVLILNFRSKSYTLPQFMEHMNKLKVLIVTNYGFSAAELDNFPVVGYLSSLRRIRLEHVSISSSLSSTSPFQLTNLQKLSLTMCDIGNALDNCANMFPNLVEIEMEYCRDLVELPKGICDVVNLNRISITSCNELCVLPDEIGRLTNLQSLRLNSCTGLQGLPETIGGLEQLNLLDISDCLSLSEMPIQIGDLQGLRTLHMSGCWGLYELPTSVEDLENLKVFCDSHTAILWEYYKKVAVVLVKEDINLNWLNK